VITATNRDLEKMVAEGTYRADLYYRLNVFTIRLPPLREREDDVPLLAQHFVHRFAKELNKNVQTIADEAMAVLRQYTWPGNVREFQSVIKQALLQATGPVLLPEFFPAAIRGRPEISEGPASAAMDPTTLSKFIQQRLQTGSTSLYADFQAVTDRHLLTLVLQHTGGNLSQASKILGITRATLRTKLHALGLSADQSSVRSEVT
jgi:DNA-binding NtrC family response regulator